MFTAANNPFVRLKHYRPHECDQKENHATECLAACLRLSASLKSAFLRLCHQRGLPVDESVIAQAEIATQEPIGDGILDLYISVPGRFHLGVEVKVAAREDQRHREQAVVYSDWLRKQEPPGMLLTLVMALDPQFDFRSCGIAHRLTWRNVFDCFTAEAESMVGTDAAVARALCGYMVNEGIVVNYEVANLAHYADGIKAQTALDAIFAQVANELTNHGYETNAQMKLEWPCLKTRSDRWKDIFGEGENYKIYLWFTVPPNWNATAHEFWPTLEIYNQDYESDWATIHARLPGWLDMLTREGLLYDVFTKDSHVTGLPANKITASSSRIYAYREPPDVTQEQMVKMDPEGLVRLLVDQVLRLAAIIDRFSQSPTT